MSNQLLYQSTITSIEKILNDSSLDLEKKYLYLLQTFLISRLEPMRQALLGHLGEPVVQSGPFAGMRFHEHQVEGCYIPKLLGIYEAELHPVIESLRHKSYARIINIGCAEGYYAIGLANLFANSRVFAFDINEQAQYYCRQLAAKNNLSARITVSGGISSKDLTQLINEEKTLIFCDIEGSEFDLLNPENIGESIHKADLIVELHHHLIHAPERAKELTEKFQSSHNIAIIPHGGRNPHAYNILNSFGHMDKMLCCCEFRPCPTPWGIFISKQEG